MRRKNRRGISVKKDYDLVFYVLNIFSMDMLYSFPMLIKALPLFIITFAFSDFWGVSSCLFKTKTKIKNK